MPMTPTRRPFTSRMVYGAETFAAPLLLAVGGHVPGVVGRQQREGGEVTRLLHEVHRARVELVVADHRRVQPHVREEFELHLAVVEVEDGRALEAVARVQVEDAIRLRALALEDRRDAGGAAERARLGDEAQVRVRLQRREVIGDEPRVDVRGMKQGEANLLASKVVVLAIQHWHARGKDQSAQEADQGATHQVVPGGLREGTQREMAQGTGSGQYGQATQE